MATDASANPEAAPRPPERPPVSDPSGSDPDDPTRPPAAHAGEGDSGADQREEAPAAASGGSVVEKKKRRKAEDGDGCKNCSCKKSRCLKLYCVCFASGAHCSDMCSCESCFNKPIHGVQQNKPAFALKVQKSDAGQESVQQVHKSPLDHSRRCTCKKSGCLKKYCDCYQSGAGCSINCRCDDCRNPFGKKVGVILDGRSHLTSNRGNGMDLDYSDNDEDDYYMNRPLSPIPPSPISRESSFQQETLVGIEVQTVNGHLYPKPLSQVRPEPWHLSRRPGEEARHEPWRSSRRPSEDGISDVMEGYTDTKFQRDSKRSWNHEDQYSISRCIEVMNGMVELSQIEKSLAPDIFLDPNNREIFLNLSVDVRTLWLRRKIKNLT